MTTYVKTSYEDGGAGDLVRYIGRDGPVKDRAGREMSDERAEQFIERSERHEFTRHMIISPETGNELSERELERETRRTMEQFSEGRPTATYAYAVHDDTEHRHAHVAATGEKTDLYMDKGDIERFREQANERMVERDRYRDRLRDLERERDREEMKRRERAAEEELTR